MSNRSVVVLTPSGRRLTVKVDPNKTLIQVLEEVCQKQSLLTDDYDLKHFNRILDVNVTFRYSNIPNNATLEMVACKTPRKLSNVTICVQLKNGERKQAEFPPNVNLLYILQNFEINYNTETVVLLYMQQEIYGKDFQKVTLKSLGLVSGKALFRLLERDPTSLREQAHVYVAPTPKVAKISEESEVHSDRLANVTSKEITFDPVTAIRAERKVKEVESDVTNQKENKTQETLMIHSNIISDASTNVVEQGLKQTECQMEVDETNVEDSNESNKNKNTPSQPVEEPRVEFLGERKALLFNKAAASALPHDEIPDEFFELTIKDAKYLLSDAIQARQKLEECPLVTNEYRKLEENIEKLNSLHKYKQAVIRIQFPNQFVLQGIFKPTETVQLVKDFVRNYLDSEETNFVLYTSPPRKDLDPESLLIDQGLVPSAIIYYAGNSDLKPELKSKLTDPSTVSFEAIKTRLSNTRIMAESPNDRSSQVPTSSKSSHSQKVPKWFKQ